MKLTHCFLLTFWFLKERVESKVFLNTPSDPTYAELGSNILLNWTYSYVGIPSFKKWAQVTESNTQIGKTIMQQQSSNAPRVLKSSFIGRAEYRPTGSLLIKNVSLQDEGYIRFQIDFEDGELLHNRIVLNVTISPKIQSALPNETVVTEGRTSSFQCTFEARPQPTISWFINGQKISNNARFNITSNVLGIFKDLTSVSSTLVISNARPNDNGIVRCSADIPLGMLFSETKHKVLYHPRNTSFNSNKQNNIAILGDDVNLTCQAASIPQPYYVIFKNGNILRNSSSRIYELKKVKISDEATYNCQAGNFLGLGIKQSLNLTVHVPTSFKTFSGTRRTAMINTTSNISCIFYGEPLPNITWQKVNETMPANVIAISHIISSNSSFVVVESVLLFNNIQRAHHGSYRCMAQNSAGNNQMYIELNVIYPPILTNNLPMNSILVENINTNHSWNCKFESNPAAHVSWMLNGLDITNDARFRINNNITANKSDGVIVLSEVIFIGIAKFKSGVLVCKANNSAGSTLSTTNVIIHYKPSMDLKPTTKNITAGATAVLSCSVHSQPLSNLTWKKDGKSVNKSRYSIITEAVEGRFNSRLTSNLTIPVAEKRDHGVFECLAINLIGNDSRLSSIEILFEPEYIAKLSESSYIAEGSRNHSLTCKVTSNPAAKISWSVNESLINAQSSSWNIIESSNHSNGQTEISSMLIFNQISKKDYANYTCIATNYVGSISSRQLLVITYKPFIINAPLMRFEVNATQSVQLFCDFQSNPSASTIWLRFNQTTGQQITLFSQSALQFNSIQYTVTRSMINFQNISLYDSGFYSCRANNSLGQSNANITLVVNFQPVFISHSPSSVFLNLLRSTMLRCSAKSNPAATILWFKDGMQIFNKSNYGIFEETHSSEQFQPVVSSSLLLRSVMKNTTGNYTCIANNKLGAVLRRTRLIVQYPPQIVSSFNEAENMTESTSSFYLECLVAANPLPKVEWYKGIHRIENSSISETILLSNSVHKQVQSRLLFRNGIKRGDHGIYKCNASNNIGTQMKTVNINVWYGPEFLSNFSGQINRTESSNVSLNCQVEGHQQPTLQWLKGNKKLIGKLTKVISSNNTRSVVQSVLNINGLTKDDTAEYTCQATNEAGRKNQGFFLNVQYKPKVLITESNITANQSDNVNLNCQADANPAVNRYIWRSNGTLLADNGPTLKITPATEASAGQYTCLPINAIGDGETVTFILSVQVRAKITKKPSCKQIGNQLYCSCYGHGIPTPNIFWTKNDDNEVFHNGTDFTLTKTEASDGRYTCHVKNKLAEATETYGVFFYVSPVGLWTEWGSCNVTCGDGFKLRSRACNFKPCTEILYEETSCRKPCSNFTGNERQTSNKDETWAIVLYVLIPVLAVLCISMIVWLANARGCRREDKEFIVPLNNNLSQPPSVRSMPTTRDIYLPDGNFGFYNSGYMQDNNDVNPMSTNNDSQQFDTIEVEMRFGDDFNGTGESEVDDRLDAINDGDPDHKNSNGVEQENLSFYNTAYTHL